MAGRACCRLNAQRGGVFWNLFNMKKGGGGGRRDACKAGCKPFLLFPIPSHFARDGREEKEKNRILALGLLQPPFGLWATGIYCTILTYIRKDFRDRLGRLRDIYFLHLNGGTFHQFREILSSKTRIVCSDMRGHSLSL